MVEDLARKRFRFKEAAVGGTFDILHLGHERLLTRAFQLSSFVFVGVSGDELVATLGKKHKVRSFSDRRRDLRKFLRAHGWQQRARIVELKDPFGPATRDRHLEALIVSNVTKKSGLKVNALRRARKLPPLTLNVVRLVKAKDGRLISTTRIRRGEIDVRGKPVRR